jgi:hypothetical protein
MDKAQLKVLTQVLEEAAREFSNHGCNDFNLTKQGLTAEEIKSFKEGFVKFMKDEDSMYESSGDYVEDWLVMRYLIKLAKDELGATP